MIEPRRFCRAISILCGWFALALVVVGLSPSLRADGIVLPPLAAPAVTMPDQRALLVWNEKEHEETLVIESRFIGQGHDFAWVVPLPSKPEIEAATSGTLPTLASLFRPRIVDLSGYMYWVPLLVFFAVRFIFPSCYGRLGAIFEANPGFAAIVVMLLAFVSLLLLGSFFGLLVLGVICFVWWHSPKQGCIGVILLVLLILLLASLVIPTVGSVAEGSLVDAAPPVEVERRMVGSNEIAVLSGGGPGGIAQWLRDHQFAVSAAAESVLTDETRAGGFFAAVKLHRADDAPGETAPAPLVFTFQTPDPVYPLALTGAGASQPLSIEIFVFGNTPAEADGLAVRYCEEVRPFENDMYQFTDWSVGTSHSYLSRFLLRSTLPLIHPSLRKLCADAKVVTFLAGTLAPSQMSRDLPIRWNWRPYLDAKMPVKPSVYSNEDGLELAVIFATVWLALAACFARWRCAPSFGSRFPPCR
jgi:hypothetical protein